MVLIYIAPLNHTYSALFPIIIMMVIGCVSLHPISYHFLITHFIPVALASCYYLEYTVLCSLVSRVLQTLVPSVWFVSLLLVLLFSVIARYLYFLVLLPQRVTPIIRVSKIGDSHLFFYCTLLLFLSCLQGLSKC